MLQRREPIEGVEQKRCCQVARLDHWVQKRGEVVKQSLVLGVEKALIIVVGRDERRKRDFQEVVGNGSCTLDSRDTDGWGGEIAQERKRFCKVLYL